MNDALPRLVASLLMLAVVGYVMPALMAWEPDPGLWDKPLRLMAVVLGFLAFFHVLKDPK